MPLLAQHFIETYATRAQKDIAGISEPVAEKLLAYSWPGNVRELRNVVERAAALTRHEKLTLDDLPPNVRTYSASQVVIAAGDPEELTTLEEVERRYILHVLQCLGDNRTLAAKTLGLDRKTLYRKLQKYGAIQGDAE